MAIKERTLCILAQSSWFGEAENISTGWESWRDARPVAVLEKRVTRRWKDTGLGYQVWGDSSMSPFACFDCLHRNGQNKAELQGDTAHLWRSRGTNMRPHSCLEVALRTLGKSNLFLYSFFLFYLQKEQQGRGLVVLPCRIFPRGNGKAWLGQKSPSRWAKGGNVEWEGLERCVRGNKSDIKEDQKNPA